MTIRFLFAPKPGKSGGPGILLTRIANEMTRRGYEFTATAFHYLGRSLVPWQYAFVMGCPRNLGQIFQSNKPNIFTMGKPESREEHRAMGRKFPPIFDQHEALMARTIMAADQVVFISEYVKGIWEMLFRERGHEFPPESKIHVIHHGIELAHFSPAGNEPERPFILGSVGQIRERFRLETLFNVSRLLDFEHRLLIVGSMTVECRKVYEMAMLNKELAVRTHYVPWVDYVMLPSYYREMHCLFHPVDYEGFGNVVAEALSCGVPVVVPAHGAPKEFVCPSGGLAVETVQFSYDETFCHRMALAVTEIRENQRAYAKGARAQALRYLSIEDRVDEYLNFMGLPRYPVRSE